MIVFSYMRLAILVMLHRRYFQVFDWGGVCNRKQLATTRIKIVLLIGNGLIVII
jgi:hypothetical protein